MMITKVTSSIQLEVMLSFLLSQLYKNSSCFTSQLRNKINISDTTTTTTTSTSITAPMCHICYTQE